MSLPHRLTYHVHDGEDVGLDAVAPMILNHLRVSHDQRLHPALFADGPPGQASPGPLAPLPLLSLSLQLLGGGKTI